MQTSAKNQKYQNNITKNIWKKVKGKFNSDLIGNATRFNTQLFYVSIFNFKIVHQ